MEEEKGNSKGLVIILVIFALMVLGLGGWIAYDKFFANKQPAEPETETTPEPAEEETDDYLLTEYGILSYGEIKPFENLDFGKKVYGEYVKLENGVIKYNNEDTDQSFDFPIEDVIQVGAECDCGGCRNIYYLNSKGELYSIEVDHGEVPEDYESKLIKKNVSAFMLFEAGLVEGTTCGGQDLIVKYNDGTIKINDYDLSALERYWLFSAESDYELYIVSNNVKVKNYLTDENGEKLVAKQIFITDVTYDSEYSIYVIDKNDYLYYNDDYTKVKLNKYNESKVKSYKENENNVTITYTDNSNETIDTSLVYDYNKEFVNNHIE